MIKNFKISEKISDALLLARQIRPYYGHALAALTPVESAECETLGVDKFWRLYWSPAFVQQTPLETLAVVIAAHEIEHLIRNHHSRCGPRDPQAWNIAGDAEINDDLLPPAEILPAGSITPETLGATPGLLAEEYYEHACDQSGGSCGGGSCGGGSGAGNPQPWELPEDDAPALSEDAAEAVRDQTAAAVREAAKNNPGSVPAGALVWANARAKKPKKSWRGAVIANARRALTRAGRSDYTWARLPRRETEALRPGTIRHVPRAAIIADTSGSCAEQGATTLGVVAELRRLFPQVQVFSCDTEVHRLKNGQYLGGGGTDLRVAFEAVTDLRPDVCFVVTDGETPWPETPPKFKTVVFLCAGGTEPPAWCETVKLGE